MFRCATALASLAAAIALSSAVQAATMVSGVIYEGGVKPATHAPDPDRVLGDFNATPGNPELKVMGDVSIWGGVAHSRNSRYTDAWAMDFGTETYGGTFSWQNTQKNPFDGIFYVNGKEYELDDAGSFRLGQLTGYVQFEVDPRKGLYSPSPREQATWDLQLTQMPLPAGAWLILTGLAGLGFVKHRKTKS